MKIFFYCILVFSCLFFIHPDALGSETYYIENNRVLLYKIINWWYDCLPEESNRLCGSPVRYMNTGNARVDYDEPEMKLKLHIHGGFGELLSIFKQCKDCYGPSYLKCIWLNREYFGHGEGKAIRYEIPAISHFAFNHVDMSHFRRMKRIEENIVFKLEGTIGGLLNGRISLHHAGTFIQSCAEVFEGKGESLTTTIKIINSGTEEILAKYSVISEK